MAYDVEDTFESGTLGNLTKYEDAGYTVEAQSSDVLVGTYSAKMFTATGPNGGSATLDDTLPFSYSDIYIQLRFKMLSGFDSEYGLNLQFVCIALSSFYNTRFIFHLQKMVTGTFGWSIECYDGGSLSEKASDTTTGDFLVGTEYRLEIHFKIATSGGGYSVEKNGVTLSSNFTYNTGSTNIQFWWFGLDTVSGALNANSAMIFDNCYVDDAYIGSGAPTLEQEGFRFRNDDGDETTATWDGNQDANLTAPAGSIRRLRFVVDTTGDVDAGQFQLEGKKSDEADWHKIN